MKTRMLVQEQCSDHTRVDDVLIKAADYYSHFL